MIKGSHHSAGALLKLSRARKGKTYEEIYGKNNTIRIKRKMLHTKLGPHKSDCRCVRCCQETCDKISVGITKSYTPELRARKSKILKRVCNDPIHRAEMSVLFTKLRKDPEYRKRQSYAVSMSPKTLEARKRKIKDPSYHKNLSAAHRRAYREGKRVPAGCCAPGYVSSRISSFEQKLNAALTSYGLHFIPQYKVPGTNYVADFYLPSVNLIVEVDLHPSHREDKRRIKHDRRRKYRLHKLGYMQLHLRRKSFKRGMKFCMGLIIKSGNKKENI